MSVAETNKQLVREYVAALAALDLDRAEAMSHPDWTEYVPGAPPGGLERLRPGTEKFLAAFSDWGPTIHEQIAEGDMVLTWLHWSGRHTADFLGVPASGRDVTFELFRLDRIRDGKLLETRFMYDIQIFLQQLRD